MRRVPYFAAALLLVAALFAAVGCGSNANAVKNIDNAVKSEVENYETPEMQNYINSMRGKCTDFSVWTGPAEINLVEATREGVSRTYSVAGQVTFFVSCVGIEKDPDGDVIDVTKYFGPYSISGEYEDTGKQVVKKSLQIR